MKRLLCFLAVSAFVLSLPACDDDDENVPNRKDPESPVDPNNGKEEETGIDALVIEANRFVEETMTDYYYWSDKLPIDLDYRKQENTEDYFYALRYSGDRFSFITDDADSFNESQEGITTSVGWEYIYSYAGQESNRIVAMINYVYKNTPAYNAGARRGDVILKVDGQEMNDQNYSTLFSKSSATYTVMRYNKEKAAANPDEPYEEVEYSITAAQIEVSPVAEHSVFEAGGHKIGYLLYMDFYSVFNNVLANVFAEFKSKGVDRLILDLRYNTGGEMTALECLCSYIAPRGNVSNKDLLIWYKFNSYLSRYSYYSKENAGSYFDPTLADATLDLNSIVVLVGKGSYSAAEATVIALQPYMDVYTIGSTTGGKNTSMIFFTPGDFTYSNSSKPYYDTAINNWLIAPIVATYYNSADYTFDTTDGDGMDPDYKFNEYSIDDMGYLGEADEPLTSLAIEYITNGSISSGNKSLREPKILLPRVSNGTRGGAIMNHIKPMAH